jgi:hypothetical protein
MTGVDLTEETTFAAAAIDLTRDLEISDGSRAAGHTKANITGLDEITAIVARSTEGW